MKLTGKITKILANFYYVQDNEGKIWECFARSRLLKEGKLLLVGDYVEIETSTPTCGVIINLKERKNKTTKPQIANVDQLLIVFSSLEPDFDFYNLDRYLSYTRYELPNEKITICINKIDLKKININKEYKNSGFEIAYVSALTKEGLDNLAKELTTKTTLLAGPSGVGKSSLIKAISPDADVKIGSLSAIKQGKHITRNVQLISFEYNGQKGLLADTPGFTQFTFGSLDPYKVLATFKELNNVGCSFDNCLHDSEEGCTLRNLDKENMPTSRFESYLKILAETKSETIYTTKTEAKIKTVGGKGNKKGKFLPKISEQKRAKSRKREKQELLKLDKDFENL